MLLKQQIIALPPFAWAEAGSVLRKICGRNNLTAQEADDLWFEFRQYPGIIYLSDEIIADKAWKISCSLNMPTLYDSSFLAVAEVITEITGEICEYWTADKKLYDSVELESKKFSGKDVRYLAVVIPDVVVNKYVSNVELKY